MFRVTTPTYPPSAPPETPPPQHRNPPQYREAPPPYPGLQPAISPKYQNVNEVLVEGSEKTKFHTDEKGIVSISGVLTQVRTDHGGKKLILSTPGQTFGGTVTIKSGNAVIQMPNMQNFSFSIRTDSFVTPTTQWQETNVSVNGVSGYCPYVASGPLETIKLDAKNIRSITNLGNGDVNAHLNQDQITLLNKGSGNFLVSGSVDSLSIENHGSGNFNLLSVKTNKLEGVSNGSGNTLIPHLEPSQIDIQSNGSGNIRALRY